MKNQSIRLSGILLAIGTFLLIARMTPVFMALDGGMESLPQTGTEILRFVTLFESAWITAHIIALIVFPLHLFAFISIYRKLEKMRPSMINLAFVIVTTLGVSLYLLAVIVDGFGVPVAVNNLQGNENATAIVGMMHGFGLTFFAPGIFGYFSGIGLMSIALMQNRYTGILFTGSGLLVSAIGIIGYVTGIFGLYWNNTQASMPAMMLMFLWMIVFGLRLAWKPYPLTEKTDARTINSPLTEAI